MTDDNVFDVIATRAWEIVEFHLVSHEVDPLDDDERDAVQLGLASGIHAAIEHFIPGE